MTSANFMRVSKFRLFLYSFFRFLTFQPKLHTLVYTDQNPKGFASQFSEDGLIGKTDTFYKFRDNLEDANIGIVYYRWEKIKLTRKNIDLFGSIYPDTQLVSSIKNLTWIGRLLYEYISPYIMGYRMILYFKSDSDFTIFQIMR